MSFLITCPTCGPRGSYEFRYGGEDKGPRPDEEGMTAQAWVEAVHLNRCTAGVVKEWWFHRDGCAAWFTIRRDTTTNLEAAPPEAS